MPFSEVTVWDTAKKEAPGATPYQRRSPEGVRGPCRILDTTSAWEVVIVRTLVSRHGKVVTIRVLGSKTLQSSVHGISVPTKLARSKGQVSRRS